MESFHFSMKWWLWSSVSQFWNPFLSSKLRLEEEIPHFCKVLNIQRFNSINMSTACLNVSVSEYPALRGMRKCFWNESSCFYLQQLFWSCLTHSVFTVRGHDISHFMSETLVRVVPEQTETKCEWIREQTPESWTWAACFPVPCDPLTDLTQQHTRISQSQRNFKSFHLCLNAFWPATCDKMWQGDWPKPWWRISAALHVKHQRATWVDSFNSGKLLPSEDC